MTTILNSPVRVYKDRVAVYFFDGRVHCDIIAPEGPERDAVLALAGQAQRMALVLRDAADVACEITTGTDDCAVHGFSFEEQCGTCRARTVLRDAGVMP